MSVIVKGIEMPKRCIDCPFMVSRDRDDCVLQTEAENELAKTWEELKAACPLVEIHTPHGRLIDVDDFMRHLINNVMDLRTLSPSAIGNALLDTPTIIEAEDN